VWLEKIAHKSAALKSIHSAVVRTYLRKNGSSLDRLVLTWANALTGC
jgi:hypothetical protein